jgi:FtsZ-binding cell division protein ZapB
MDNITYNINSIKEFMDIKITNKEDGTQSMQIDFNKIIKLKEENEELKEENEELKEEKMHNESAIEDLEVENENFEEENNQMKEWFKEINEICGADEDDPAIESVKDKIKELKNVKE